MRKLFWAELTTLEFAALSPETIAVLPIAAMEQHGPHLAVSTDTVIADGMVAEVVKRLPEDLPVVILPTQQIGKSNEHLRSPGTITRSIRRKYPAMRYRPSRCRSVPRHGVSIVITRFAFASAGSYASARYGGDDQPAMISTSGRASTAIFFTTSTSCRSRSSR